MATRWALGWRFWASSAWRNRSCAPCRCCNAGHRHQPLWPAATAASLPAEWPRVLHELGALLSQDAPPPKVRAAIEALASASPAQRTRWPNRRLAHARGQGGAPCASDAAERLLVAAALRACWTHPGRAKPRSSLPPAPATALAVAARQSPA